MHLPARHLHLDIQHKDPFKAESSPPHSAATPSSQSPVLKASESSLTLLFHSPQSLSQSCWLSLPPALQNQGLHRDREAQHQVEQTDWNHTPGTEANMSAWQVHKGSGWHSAGADMGSLAQPW